MSETLSIQVATGTDDAVRFTTFLINDGNLCPFWAHPAIEMSWGIRWRSVTVPAAGAALIEVAHMTWVSEGTDPDYSHVSVIWGEKSNDPATFSTPADFDGRTRTDESVSYTLPAVTLNASYNTPSLVDLIQEIVNQPGFAEDSLVLLQELEQAEATSVSGYSYEYDSSKSGIIYIEYRLLAKAGGGVMAAMVGAGLL